MAFFVNLQFNEDGLVMSNRKGLILKFAINSENDMNVLPHKVVSNLLDTKTNDKHSLSIGLLRCSALIIVLLK